MVPSGMEPRPPTVIDSLLLRPTVRKVSPQPEQHEAKGDDTPIVYLLYEFLTEPQSSFPSTVWALSMAAAACAKVLLVFVESLDSPAKYASRHNNSYYYMIPDSMGLWVAYLFCAIPLLVDCSLRALTVLLVRVGAGTSRALREMRERKLSTLLLVLEILSMVPYCVVIYLTSSVSASSTSGDSSSSSSSSGSNGGSVTGTGSSAGNSIAASQSGLVSLSQLGLDEPSRVVLRVLESFALARCARYFQHAHSLKHVIRTIHRAFRPTLSIVLLLISVNLVLGALYFYVEPCYVSGQSAPLPSSLGLEGWSDGQGLGPVALGQSAGLAACSFPTLFDAFYFSLGVTTFVGYPIGSPRTFPGQALCFLSQAAGALWLGLVLAIVGREYARSLEEEFRVSLALKRSQLLEAHHSQHLSALVRDGAKFAAHAEVCYNSPTHPPVDLTLPPREQRRRRVLQAESVRCAATVYQLCAQVSFSLGLNPPGSGASTKLRVGDGADDGGSSVGGGEEHKEEARVVDAAEAGGKVTARTLLLYARLAASTGRLHSLLLRGLHLCRQVSAEAEMIAAAQLESLPPATRQDSSTTAPPSPDATYAGDSRAAWETRRAEPTAANPGAYADEDADDAREWEQSPPSSPEAAGSKPLPPPRGTRTLALRIDLRRQQRESDRERNDEREYGGGRGSSRIGGRGAGRGRGRGRGSGSRPTTANASPPSTPRLSAGLSPDGSPGDSASDHAVTSAAGGLSISPPSPEADGDAPGGVGGVDSYVQALLGAGLEKAIHPQDAHTRGDSLAGGAGGPSWEEQGFDEEYGEYDRFDEDEEWDEEDELQEEPQGLFSFMAPSLYTHAIALNTQALSSTVGVLAGEVWTRATVRVSRRECIKARLERAAREPHLLKSRLFLLLHAPRTSVQALIYFYLHIAAMVLAVALLCAETTPSIGVYGPATLACQQATQIYCADNKAFTTDPGCFVQPDPNKTANSATSPARLRFHCSEQDCYGRGYNFGTTLYTLDSTSASTNTKSVNVYRFAGTAAAAAQCRSLFQSQVQLDYAYGPPSIDVGLTQRSQQHALCERVECSMSGSHTQFFDSVVATKAASGAVTYTTSTAGSSTFASTTVNPGSPAFSYTGGNSGPADPVSAMSVARWLAVGEGVLFALWAGDGIMRLLAAESLFEYLMDPLIACDWLALVPFAAPYALRDSGLSFTPFGGVDLNNLPSYFVLPAMLLGVSGSATSAFAILQSLKLLRLARLWRLFPETELVSEAVFRLRMPLLCALGLLMLLSFFLAVIIYEVEGPYTGFHLGTPLAVGFYENLITFYPSRTAGPGASTAMSGTAGGSGSGPASSMNNLLEAWLFLMSTLTRTGSTAVMPTTYLGLVLGVAFMAASASLAALGLVIVGGRYSAAASEWDGQAWGQDDSAGRGKEGGDAGLDNGSTNSGEKLPDSSRLSLALEELLDDLDKARDGLESWALGLQEPADRDHSKFEPQGPEDDFAKLRQAAASRPSLALQLHAMTQGLSQSLAQSQPSLAQLALLARHREDLAERDRRDKQARDEALRGVGVTRD